MQRSDIAGRLIDEVLVRLEDDADFKALPPRDTVLALFNATVSYAYCKQIDPNVIIHLLMMSIAMVQGMAAIDLSLIAKVHQMAKELGIADTAMG